MQVGGDSAVTLDTLYVVIRGTVLVIASLGACMSIFLGWKLYRDGAVSSVDGEASTGTGWKLRLTAAGPGVFFALFGMWLLVHLVNRSLEMEDEYQAASPAGQAAAAPASAAYPALFLAAAVQPQPVAKPTTCVIARRRRVLLDGDVSPDQVREALRTAIVVMEKRRGKLSSQKAARIADAVDVLTELEASTGTWPIAD
jgi:hypothetical protein